MRFRRFALLLTVVVLLFARTAKADTVKVDGTYSYVDSKTGDLMPPYGGTLNGVSQKFYCVDFSTPIWAGESWTVNITNLGGSNFSLTRLGNQTTYLEMAWLITQMMGTTNQLQKAMDQFAIWSFTGGPNPYGTNSSLVAAALAAVTAGFKGQGWEILTPTGSNGQELLVYVSEPAELLMLLVGLILFGIVRRRKRVARAHAI